MMKKWLLPIGGLAVVAAVAVVALAAAGVFDGDDASGDRTSAEADGDGSALGVCVEGVEDCVDTVVDTDGGDGADQGLDQICLAGSEDCDDSVDGSDGFEQTCLAGSEDCDDTAGSDGFEQICAAGSEGCDDTVEGSDGFDEKPGDEGTSVAPTCAPDHPDCVDMIVAEDGGSSDAEE
jgi:hypothetical protein